VNHFELIIPERLVAVEGIDGDIHLPNPLVAEDAKWSAYLSRA
jgi:hypothetical protein